MDALFKKHAQSAKQRNIAFGLEPQEHRALVTSPCAYCGEHPSDRPHPYMKVRLTHNGIDRIDGAKGYVAGNVAPCCPTCNFAKGQMTGEQFKVWVARAYTHMHQ